MTISEFIPCDRILIHVLVFKIDMLRIPTVKSADAANDGEVKSYSGLECEKYSSEETLYFILK